MRLTDAQMGLLGDIVAGAQLVAHFDRDRTVWWKLEPNGPEVPHALVEGLVRKGALLLGDPQRRPGGRHEARYAVTEAAKSQMEAVR